LVVKYNSITYEREREKEREREIKYNLRDVQII